MNICWCMLPYTLHNTPQSTHITWVIIYCKSQNNTRCIYRGTLYQVYDTHTVYLVCLIVSMTPQYNLGDDAAAFNLQPSDSKMTRVFTHLRRMELLSSSPDGAPPGQGVMASIGLNNVAVVGRNS